jgi:hypothetical protein
MGYFCALAVGPLSAFDFPVVEEALVVDGDEFHFLHVAHGHDGFDGFVDLHDFAGVLHLFVLGGEAGQVVAEGLLDQRVLFSHGELIDRSGILGVKTINLQNNSAYPSSPRIPTLPPPQKSAFLLLSWASVGN